MQVSSVVQLQWGGSRKLLPPGFTENSTFVLCVLCVSCSSGISFSYLNCSLVFCAVPCSLHLKADYICPHIPFSFRSDGELVCQVFAHLATWWCRCGILVFAFFLTIDRKKTIHFNDSVQVLDVRSRRRWKSLSEERGKQYQQINSN